MTDKHNWKLEIFKLTWAQFYRSFLRGAHVTFTRDRFYVLTILKYLEYILFIKCLNNSFFNKLIFSHEIDRALYLDLEQKEWTH